MKWILFILSTLMLIAVAAFPIIVAIVLKSILWIILYVIWFKVILWSFITWGMFNKAILD